MSLPSFISYTVFQNKEFSQRIRRNILLKYTLFKSLIYLLKYLIIYLKYLIYLLRSLIYLLKYTLFKILIRYAQILNT